MRTSKLTESQKDHVVQSYQGGGQWTQDRLAELYGVSRKTIYRILQQAGVLETPQLLSPGSARIVELVRARGLDADLLEQALDQPILSRNNMIAVLAALPLTELQVLFADVIQRKHLNNPGTLLHVPNHPDFATEPAVVRPEDAVVPDL